MKQGHWLFHSPKGQRIASTSPASPSGSVTALERDNANHHIHVSAKTGASQWDGQRMDHHHVIDIYYQLAERPAAFAT